MGRSRGSARKRGGGKSKESGIEKFGQSEVDAFHSKKDVVQLNGDDDADDSSASSDEGSEDWVMDDVKEADDSSDSSVDTDEEENEQLKAWGKQKSKYYGADTNELEIEYDSDDANDEEEEAKRLSKVQGQSMQNADFDLDDDSDSSDDDSEDQDLGTRSDKISKSSSASKKDSEGGKKKKKSKKKKKKGSSTGAVVESITRDVSNMSRSEKLQILMNESPEVRAYLVSELAHCRSQESNIYVLVLSNVGM